MSTMLLEEAPNTAPAGAPARPEHRLRDLRGRDLALAIATAVLVLVPFIVALVRSYHDGWVPSGDEGNIATRSLDVFSRHPPLTGLPSTSFLYGKNIYTNHPGPLEFYLIAVPLRLFGETSGPLLTAAFVNLSAVLIALWVIFRRAGLHAMLWAGIVMQAVIWSAGTAVLVDTLSSNMPLYSVLCTAVLVWALIDGDIRLLPLAVFVASYAAQQHLAATLLVAALTVTGVIGIVVQVIVRKRRGDETVVRTALRYGLVAFGVATVCWLPVVIDEATGHPGNITAIIDFARDNNRPTLGMGSGLRQAALAVTPATVLGHTDATGFTFIRSVGVVRWAGFLLVLGALAAIGIAAWNRRRSLSRFVIVTFVLLGAGIVNGSNVPLSTEMSRVNLYRWTWGAAFMTWTAIGWGAGVFLAPGARSLAQRAKLPARAQYLAPVTLVVVAALITSATVSISGKDDHNRERTSFPYEPGIAKTVLDRIDRHQPVLVTVSGGAATDIGFYLVFRLVQAGVPVKAPPGLAQSWGKNRTYHADTTTPTLLITSSAAPTAPGPGRVIVDKVFDPEYSAVLDDLTKTATSQPLQIAPNADAIINRDFPEPSVKKFVTAIFQLFPRDPRGFVANDIFLRLIEEGVVTAPSFDLAKVRRMRQLITTRKNVLNDERLRVTLLSPQEMRSVRIPGLPPLPPIKEQ